MDLIQVMGSPSANRSALGNHGVESSSNLMNDELGSDFNAQFNAAVLDGQVKEVNPDELIAQLVALDLNLGQLPILSDGNSEYELNGSLGKLGDCFNQEQETFVDLGSTKVNQLVSGLANSLLDSKSTGKSVDLDSLEAFVKSLPEGKLKATLMEKLETLKSGEYSREIKGYLTELFSKVVHTSLKGLAADRNPENQVEVCFMNPSVESETSTDSTAGSTSSDSVTDEYYCDVNGGYGWVNPGSLNSQPTNDSVSKIDENNLSQLSQGPTWSSKGPGNVGYKGTGQGRPDDRDWIIPIHGGVIDSRAEAGRVREFALDNAGEIKLKIEEGHIISKSVIPTQAINPEDLTAPQIIESLAGRLTRESIGLMPQKTGLVSNLTESVQEIGREPSDAIQLTVSDRVPQGGKSQTGDFEQSLLAKSSFDQDIDLLANQIEFDEDLSEQFQESPSNQEVLGLESAKTEIATKSVEKNILAAERSVREARDELTQTVLDLVSARRPQSIKIQLTPFELGTIDVSVKQGGGRVDVDLKASDDAVRQSLANQRADLVQSIESKGTTVSSMNVGQQGSQNSTQSDGHGGHQTTREDFNKAVTLGQVSSNSDSPIAPPSSYRTRSTHGVDLAA